MEFSCFTIEWFNSLDYSLYKFLTMTEQEKFSKIKSLNKMIIELKANPQVNSKETIQKLQQEIYGYAANARDVVGQPQARCHIHYPSTGK